MLHPTAGAPSAVLFRGLRCGRGRRLRLPSLPGRLPDSGRSHVKPRAETARSVPPRRRVVGPLPARAGHRQPRRRRGATRGIASRLGMGAEHPGLETASPAPSPQRGLQRARGGSRTRARPSGASGLDSPEDRRGAPPAPGPPARAPDPRKGPGAPPAPGPGSGPDGARGVGGWVTFPGSAPPGGTAGPRRRPLTPRWRRTYPAASLRLPPSGPDPSRDGGTGRNVPCVPAAVGYHAPAAARGTTQDRVFPWPDAHPGTSKETWNPARSPAHDLSPAA